MQLTLQHKSPQEKLIRSNSNEPYDVKVTKFGLSSTLNDAFNVNAKPICLLRQETLQQLMTLLQEKYVAVSTQIQRVILLLTLKQHQFYLMREAIQPLVLYLETLTMFLHQHLSFTLWQREVEVIQQTEILILLLIL